MLANMCIWVMLLLLSWMILMIDGTTILAKLINNDACYFDKLTWRVRLKLHQSYCSSLGANSGPLTVVLLSSFVLHGERA